MALVCVTGLLTWGCTGIRPDRPGTGSGGPDTLAARPGPIDLPAGVTVMGTDEVWEMIAAGEAPVLIDTRPEQEYLRSHLAGALSIPGAEVQPLRDRLPGDRSRLLVFYGQGPT